jgi:hypothetical protein
MLQPSNNRSIARFLLPMADIMALLFSFFLLLPHLETEPGKQEGNVPGSYWSPAEQEKAREELARLRRLRQLPVDQRLKIVVLDIDGSTGELLLNRGAGQQRLNATNIDEVIRNHQASARAEDLELFYLLRVPRPDAQGSKPHPTAADEALYRRWFGRRQVDYRIDFPQLQE